MSTKPESTTRLGRLRRRAVHAGVGAWRWFGGLRRRRPLAYWSSLLVGVPMLLAFLVVFGVVVAAQFGTFGRLPGQRELRRFRMAEASQLLSADGQVLGRYFDENRTLVPFDELPPALVDALIATEDARFYEHTGVDFRATARAVVYSVLLGREEQGGGSTLSQQLAKNVYPRRRSGTLALLGAKAREGIIARRLERIFSKEQVVEHYLNTVPFGDRKFGIRVAALGYFGVEPADLRPEQAATLVGLLKANSSYHPVRHPEAALRRRNLVLARMRDQGKLTGAAFDSLAALPLGVRERPALIRANHSHLSAAVRREAEAVLAKARRPDGKRYDLDRDGLRVHTTIDATAQAIAERALRAHLGDLQRSFRKQYASRDPAGFDALLRDFIRATPRYRLAAARGESEAAIEARFAERRTVRYGKHSALGERTVENSTYRDSARLELLRLRAGFQVADPYTGAVLAYVGGEDYAGVPFDALGARRQVGSTFKPLVYAAALERGYGPCDYFANALRTYTVEGRDWTPGNSDGDHADNYSLGGALVHSANTVTAALIDEGAIDRRVRASARALGLPELPPGPTVALGTGSATVPEMMRVYATIRRGGTSPPPWRLLTRIETRDGESLYESPLRRVDGIAVARAGVIERLLGNGVDSGGRRVLEDSVAAQVDLMLRGVVARGTAAALPGRMRVRTELAAKTGTTQDQADGWLLGYSRDLVFGAWVGGAYPSIRWRTSGLGSGSRTALPIVGKFFEAYEKKAGVTRLPPVAPHILAAAECPDRQTDEELRGPTFWEEVEALFGKPRERARRGERGSERRQRTQPRRSSPSRRKSEPEPVKRFFRDLFGGKG